MRAQAQGESPCKGKRTVKNGGEGSSSSAGVVVSAGLPHCVQQHEYCLRAGQHAEVNPRRTGKMSEKKPLFIATPSVEGTECQGLVVDLSLALRVATMDKYDLEALCQTRGVQLPAAIARVSKSQLITRLLSQASWDPAQSHDNVLLPAFGSGHCQKERLHSALHSSLEIIVQHLCHYSHYSDLLSTMCLSRACLVSRAWQKMFSLPGLHTILDCNKLTRPAFLRELTRSPNWMFLTIGDRPDWSCSRDFRKALKRSMRSHQASIDLTVAGPNNEWWHSDSVDAWRVFEKCLFASLRAVGGQGGLRNLVAVDFSFESRSSVYGVLFPWWMESHLIEFSSFCPRLQHLCLPTRLSNCTDVLLLWKELRTFSIGTSNYWKIPRIGSCKLLSQPGDAGSLRGSAAEEEQNGICFQTLECISLPPDEEVLFCAMNDVRKQFCGEVFNRIAQDGRGEILLRWMKHGGVFESLRQMHLRPLVSHGSSHLNVQQERFPALEDLKVTFVMNMCSHDRRVKVDLPTLRKLSIHCPCKNTGGLLSLRAPNLELLIFKGGGCSLTPPCCQINRALLQRHTGTDLLHLKAFSWSVEDMNDHKTGAVGAVGMALGAFDTACSGSSLLVLHKLLTSPLCLEAAGLDIPILTAMEKTMVLPLQMKAFSLKMHIVSYDGNHVDVPMHIEAIDTSVAAVLRWLKISLSVPYECQLLKHLANDCPLLEHVYLSGPDTNCCMLGQLGTSLSKLQVISVSYASKKEITQVLTGPSAQSIRHVEVDCLKLNPKDRDRCANDVAVLADSELKGWIVDAESFEVAGAHWWDQLCGLSFNHVPPALTTLVFDNGQGHSYIWTSEPAAYHISPLSSAHGAASAAEIHGAGCHTGEAQEANGWHRAWRKQDDRVARRLAALQVHFFAELAASIHGSSIPSTLSVAGGSNRGGGHNEGTRRRTNGEGGYTITCDDLRLVLTGL